MALMKEIAVSCYYVMIAPDICIPSLIAHPTVTIHSLSAKVGVGL